MPSAGAQLLTPNPSISVCELHSMSTAELQLEGFAYPVPCTAALLLHRSHFAVTETILTYRVRKACGLYRARPSQEAFGKNP